MSLSLVLSVIISSVAMTSLSGLVTLVGETNGQQNQTSVDKYVLHEGDVKIILGYCYQHADRPNPVQDLVNKSLVSADFAGDTCASVKQGSQSEEVRITEAYYEVATHASSAYDECLLDKSPSDCLYLIREFCAIPEYARFMNNCPP